MMKREIISHDVATGIAVIRFQHGDVDHTAEYDLKKVVPSAERIFEELGLAFGERSQQGAIDALTRSIEAQIDAGASFMPPEGAEAPQMPDEPKPEEPVPEGPAVDPTPPVSEETAA